MPAGQGRAITDGMTYVVELSGVLDPARTQALAAVLEEALETDAGRIVLDLSNLEAIDRAGVYAILLVHLRAADQLKPLLIVPGPPAVQRVFDAVQGPFSYSGSSGALAASGGSVRAKMGSLRDVNTRASRDNSEHLCHRCIHSGL
jgi:anti-anti-sigma factor